MATDLCNTIYVYIYDKMYKNYINHFFKTIVYFLHHRIEWPHLTLSVSLNGQIRYFYWSKTKSIYILLHFHRKYRFSEKFTWVGKFVILYVQVLYQKVENFPKSWIFFIKLKNFQKSWKIFKKVEIFSKSRKFFKK